jgi:hypothetical protein
MIEIQDIQGKTKSEIIDLIKEQNSTSFEIYIPKSTILFSSSNEDIAIEYNKLAFAGHLLKNITTYFQYEEVAPDAKESVKFIIENQDIEILASTLLEISFGYVNDEAEEKYKEIEEDYDFWMNADQYLSDVAKGSIKEVACPYFCQIAQQFLMK